MRSRLSSLSFAVAALAALVLAFPMPAFAQDVPIARRAPITCPSSGPIYPYYNTTDHLWHCTSTQPALFNAATITATSTEINRLAGVTPGTVAVSKYVAVGATGKVDTWDPTVLKKNGTTITATAAELNTLAGVTAGTISPSKAIVVDANGATLTLKTAALSLGTSGSETAVTATGAELNKLAGVTGGTVTASKGVVVDANKAIDESRITTQRSLGGTGVPGAAAVQTELTKAVTAFTDTTAKDVFTVTVPNAAHAAVIEVDVLGVLGAGGAIGAGEGSRTVKYQVVLARTAGVNVVATASSAIGGAEAHVAGAASVTSVVVTVSAITGAVGATNTFTIKVAITKSGGSSDNHTAVATARILNQNATGVTIQ